MKQPSPSQMRGVSGKCAPTLCLSAAPALAKPPKPHAKEKTNDPPPTSPHEFHQVAVADLVAEIANVDPVFSLADLGELDGLFMVGIHRAAQRARESVAVLAATAAAGTSARPGGPGASARPGTARTAPWGRRAPGARPRAGTRALTPLRQNQLVLSKIDNRIHLLRHFCCQAPSGRLRRRHRAWDVLHRSWL